MTACFGASPLGIVGARVYYVLFYLDRFRTSDGKFDFGSAIAFWDGGLAIYGTVIAVIILAVCLSRRKGKRGFKFFAMTDLVVMGLLVGQIVGRWGNFMNREAFGSETTCLFPHAAHHQGRPAHRGTSHLPV